MRFPSASASLRRAASFEIDLKRAASFEVDLKNAIINAGSQDQDCPETFAGTEYSTCGQLSRAQDQPPHHLS